MIYIILFLIGISIRVYSATLLNNKNFLLLRGGSTLVENSIYGYIRHPMYLGSIIMGTGLFGMITGDFGITACLIIILINFLLHRIDVEEDLLIKKYGQDYINYKSKTKYIIPFIF